MKTSATKHISLETRYFPGCLGALMGTLIGMVLWILFFLLGTIPGTAGLLMMILAIAGFRLLGKRVSFPGIGICLVLCIAGIYLAHRIGYAIGITLENDYSFSESFRGIENFMIDSPEFASIYWLNLILGYGALLLALLAVLARYVWKRVRAKKKKSL